MFKKLLPLIVLSLLWCAPAHAQNITCATRPPVDNSNACASTAFVQSAVSSPTVPIALPTGSTAVTQTYGDNSTKVATDAFVQAATQGAQNYIDPRQSPYNAAGNCLTDDSAAISAASVAALASGQTVIISTCYAINTNSTFGAPFVFTSSGYFTVATSITANLTNANVNAMSLSWVFRGAGSVVLTNAPWQSVAWWGAYAAALAGTDTVPGIMAAVGSNRTIYFPPGVTYKFLTYFTNAASEGTSGNIVTANLYFKNLSNFHVEAFGASFQERATASTVGLCACEIFMDGNNTFTWNGGIMIADKTTVNPNGAGIAAFVNHNAQNFVISNVQGTGNWGYDYTGVACTTTVLCSTFLAGDYEINGRYENISCGACGFGFDLAFLHHIIFDNINMTGADQNGSAASGHYGRSEISIIYDPPSVCAGCNTTGVTLGSSDDISIINTRSSNMYYGELLEDGAVYNLSNDYIVGGNATPPGYGIYFATNHPASAPTNINVTNSVITGWQTAVNWATTGGGAGGFTRFYFENDAIQGSTTGFASDDATGTIITDVRIGPTVGFASTTTPLNTNMALVTAIGVTGTTCTKWLNGMCTHL